MKVTRTFTVDKRGEGNPDYYHNVSKFGVEAMSQLEQPGIRLDSYEIFHRYGLKPSNFYYGNGFDLDANWTNDGFTNVAGEWLMAYSKKTWLYPALSAECIWPALATPDLNAYLGFESGGRGLISRYLFNMKLNTFRLDVGGAGVLRIDNFLPADYDSVWHRYGLKLNKCNIEAFIDGILVGIVLLGIPEAIPAWSNTDPYALITSRWKNTAMRTPIAVLLEPTGVRPSITLDIRWEDWQLVCNDGDPLPPRQYALYTENTTTKWTGLATAGAVLTSHPVPVWGYPRKTLVFQADAAGNLDIQVYVGGGWRSWVPGGITLVANQLEVYNLNGEVPIARCVYTPTNADTITVAEWYLS